MAFVKVTAPSDLFQTVPLSLNGRAVATCGQGTLIPPPFQPKVQNMGNLKLQIYRLASEKGHIYWTLTPFLCKKGHFYQSS